MIKFGEKNKEKNKAPFLIKTIEEMDNDVTFIISLPIEENKSTNIDVEKILTLHEFKPLCSSPTNLYKIVFENYILYQTRNESYTVFDDYEIRKGDFFIIFEKSRLLDCVSQLINIELVDTYYPNGYKHYGIYCENHIIDIIATKEPVITRCI